MGKKKHSESTAKKNPNQPSVTVSDSSGGLRTLPPSSRLLVFNCGQRSIVCTLCCIWHPPAPAPFSLHNPGSLFACPAIIDMRRKCQIYRTSGPQQPKNRSPSRSLGLSRQCPPQTVGQRCALRCILQEATESALVDTGDTVSTARIVLKCQGHLYELSSFRSQCTSAL